MDYKQSIQSVRKSAESHVNLRKLLNYDANAQVSKKVVVLDEWYNYYSTKELATPADWERFADDVESLTPQDFGEVESNGPVIETQTGVVPATDSFLDDAREILGDLFDEIMNIDGGEFEDDKAFTLTPSPTVQIPEPLPPPVDPIPSVEPATSTPNNLSALLDRMAEIAELARTGGFTEEVENEMEALGLVLAQMDVDASLRHHEQKVALLDIMY